MLSAYELLRTREVRALGHRAPSTGAPPGPQEEPGVCFPSDRVSECTLRCLSPLTHKETAQRSTLTCPELHSKAMAEMGFEIRLCSENLQAQGHRARVALGLCVCVCVCRDQDRGRSNSACPRLRPASHLGKGGPFHSHEKSWGLRRQDSQCGGRGARMGLPLVSGAEQAEEPVSF